MSEIISTSEITSAYKSDNGAVYGTAPDAVAIVRRYRVMRAAGMPASRALTMARTSTLSVYPGRYGWNPVFKIGGVELRWLEKPSENGLRFVGFCDQIAKIGHTGWHLDDDGMGDVAQGGVWRLPARGGVSRYLAGVVDPYNGAEYAAAFEVETFTDANDAARSSDRLAERYAESERAYHREEQARNESEELGERVAAYRREIRELLREIRQSTVAYGPKVCATLRERVKSLRSEIRDARRRLSLLMETTNS